MTETNCGTCPYNGEGRCRFHAPSVDSSGRAQWPRIVEGEWCRHHPDFAQLLTKQKRKAPKAEKVANIVKREDIVRGTFDELEPAEVMKNEPLLVGLMFILGSTQQKAFGLSKRRRDAIKETLKYHRVSDYAKACEGWMHDPTGYWNGEARGEEPKNPDPVKVAQHLEKFLDFYNAHHNGAEDKALQEDPQWLKG